MSHCRLPDPGWEDLVVVGLGCNCMDWDFNAEECRGGEKERLCLVLGEDQAHPPRPRLQLKDPHVQQVHRRHQGKGRRRQKSQRRRPHTHGETGPRAAPYYFLQRILAELIFKFPSPGDFFLSPHSPEGLKPTLPWPRAASQSFPPPTPLFSARPHAHVWWFELQFCCGYGTWWFSEERKQNLLQSVTYHCNTIATFLDRPSAHDCLIRLTTYVLARSVPLLAWNFSPILIYSHRWARGGIPIGWPPKHSPPP